MQYFAIKLWNLYLRPKSNHLFTRHTVSDYMFLLRYIDTSDICPLAQFRYTEIQPNTKVLSTRLGRINPTNSVLIP